jgi:uncharacterized protein YciI
MASKGVRMFVVVLTYVKPLDVVDGLLEAHIRYLNEQYERGVFVLSGPQAPRTGGVILARAENREALMAVLDRDPFKIEGAARYDVMEFVANMTAPDCRGLLEKM